MNPLVVIHNGAFGTVTAGPMSVDAGDDARERRDRLRAAWLLTASCSGAWWADGGLIPVDPGAWPVEARWSAPTWHVCDLAVAAGVLAAYYGLPAPHPRARFLGVVHLDGRVSDGVVWMDRRPEEQMWSADSDARTITHLADLPALMFWVADPRRF